MGKDVYNTLHVRQLYAAVFSGLLLLVAHSETGSLYWGFLALVPLLRSVSVNASLKRVFTCSILAASGPAIVTGESIIWSHPIAFAGIWVIQVPQIALPLMTWRSYSNKGRLRASVLFATVWLIWEQLWLMPSFFSNYASVYSLAFVFAGTQHANLLANLPLPLLTATLLASNLLLSSLRPSRLLAAGACIAIVLITLNRVPFTSPAIHTPTGSVKISLLQPGLTSAELSLLHNFEFAAHSYLREYVALVRESEPLPSLLILPETALPTAFSRTVFSSLFSPLPQLDVLAGTIWSTGNSAALFIEDDSEEVHRKLQLVPFHETRLFQAGNSVSTVELSSGLVIGILICLDGINPWLISQTVRAGADLIVVMNGTNYGRNTSTPRLQFEMSRALASQHRVPIAIVSSNGPSGYIDGNGQVIRVDEGVQALLSVEHEY